MFYYAEINSEYQVINKYCLSEESTNSNYILITEDLYNNGNERGDIVGQFYNSLSGAIEVIDPMWDMGQTCWMRYKDGQMKLSTKLDNMDVTISNKADVDHIHNGYANSNHIHTEYVSTNELQVLEDIVGTKADEAHVHSNYAHANHSHNDYATVVSVDELEGIVNAKANISHSHTEYALNIHEHDYAEIGHTHTPSEIGAATSGHNHDSSYATITSVNELADTVSDKANVTTLNSHTSNTAIHITNAERESWNVKSNFSGNYNDLTNKPSIPSISGLATETYVDEAVSTKANSSHTHTIANVSGLQNALNAKSDTTHNHNSTYDTIGAAANALSSANTYTDEAIDTLSETVATKANTSALTSHTGNTIVHVTEANKSNWNAAKTHADSAHAPTTNATQTASGLMSPDDKIKLDSVATGANAYTHPTYTARTGVPTANQTPAFGETFIVSQPVSDGTGHITAINSRTITIPSAVATASANGLMSKSDKSKLDGMVVATVSEVETYLAI